VNHDAVVVIPAKNAAKFLEESVTSVINQKTSFDFGIYIVNDHSSDLTSQIAKDMVARYKNIQVIESHGSGISDALNTGIQLANCSYIIRHDADDIMLEGRIQNQLELLSLETQYVVVGGQIEPFGVNQLPTVNRYPLSDREIRRFSLFGNPFAHPTTSFRLDAVKTVGMYRSEWNGAEDYDLWLRLLRIGKGVNLPQLVTQYRVHPGQVTNTNSIKVNSQTLRLQLKNMGYLIHNRQFASGVVCGLAVITKFTRNLIRRVLHWI